MKTMKKYLSFITFAIMAVFGLALVSCGGDDDEDSEFNEGGGVTSTTMTTINGKRIYADDMFTWPARTNYGEFRFGTWYGHTERDRSLLIIFRCDDVFTPKVGQDLTKEKGFSATGSKTKDLLEYADYTSGSAKVTKLYHEFFVVEFKNCNFSNELIINGQITMPYE